MPGLQEKIGICRSFRFNTLTDIYETLYETLGKELFTTLFPVILTDNGSEFSNPKAIEYGN